MAFRFPPHIRPYVESLADLMYYANSRDDGKWANQSSDPESNGVFGAAEMTVRMIVREVCGQKVLNYIECSRYGWNFGGCGSFLADIEAAVQDALDEIKDHEVAEQDLSSRDD